MLGLGCRALPSTLKPYATSRSALSLLSRPVLPLTPQQTPPAARPFSSLLARLPSTTPTRPSLPSLEPQHPQAHHQTRPFSASAALAGKRRTYNPSRKVQKRRHGFLARLRTRGGRKVLAHRRSRGKLALSW